MEGAMMSTTRVMRSYFLEAKYEFLNLLRTPSFVLPTLIFPALFYTLFGVLLNRNNGDGPAQYLLATYGVFGIMGAALFGLGVTIAIDRERGLLVLKRALPMPAGALLLAKTIMAMIFATLISLILATIAISLAGVSLHFSQWVQLFLVNVLGVIPFAAIGLLIGSYFSGRAAPAIINILYLPLAFLSGLWLPLSMLPSIFAKLAVLWPSWHLGQIALKVVGRDDGVNIAIHLVVLAVVALLAFTLALRRLNARL
jgi:ABC-2 type transport system permease protein